MFHKLWKIRRDGGGGYSLLKKTENPGRREVLSEIPSVVGGLIFSGTTQWKEKHPSRNLGITDVSGYRKNFTSQVRTRFGLLSLLYTRCLAHFEAISASFSDFPAPDVNSKGQRSYCATRSYFLLAALLHVQKLRPAKRVITAFKVPQINCSSFTK